MISIKVNRWQADCVTCHFRYTTPMLDHMQQCPQGHTTVELRRIVHRPTMIGRWPHGCRAGDRRPRESPPLPGPDADGGCSWGCRGSFSPLCVCPCGGRYHGTLHLLQAALGAVPIEDIFARIEASPPRGDAIVRKLEARRRRR